MVIVRDLLKYSPSFRIGFFIVAVVALLVVLSFFSPYEPDDRRGAA